MTTMQQSSLGITWDSDTQQIRNNSGKIICICEDGDDARKCFDAWAKTFYGVLFGDIPYNRVADALNLQGYSDKQIGEMEDTELAKLYVQTTFRLEL